MFERLKKLLGCLDTNSHDGHDYSHDDYLVAAGALLIHIAVIDGLADDRELKMVVKMLGENFNLTDHEAHELFRKAAAKEQKSVDIYSFTSLLKRSLAIDQRLKIVEMMCQIAFADGVLHEFEDNTIWRACELLGVSTRDRTTIRRRVMKEVGLSD